MSLNRKAIETISVSAVRDSIVMSDFLDQFIEDNDKEPSWDGFVYIYEDKSKKKEKLKGRLPVQIKGTECNDLSKEEISFLMSTVDLRNYLYDGGCVLFVVYIGNSGVTRKIYYAELTPIKLRNLLTETKKQKNKSVHLKEFPNDNNKKATIFFNCLQNCQKQASFIEGKLLTLEELQKQGVLENFVIPFSGVGVKDPHMAIIKNEVYIYAKIKGCSIPQPIEMIPQDIYTEQVLDTLVTINEKVYYTECSVIKSVKGTTYRYGSSLTISFSEQDEYTKINYKNSDNIRVLAKDLDFMLSNIDNGYFQVNDVKITFDNDGIDFTNFNIEKERQILRYAQKIVKVLNTLNCSDDININDMNDEDWVNLNRLITAFIDKKSINGLKEDLPPVCCMKVGKLRFAIYFKKCKEKGKYELLDFFKTYFSVVFKDNDGKSLPISQFYILHSNDFLTLSNMDFDVLLPSFQKVKHHYETFNRANLFLLELLIACDKAEEKLKEKLLKVCKDFCNWIDEATNEELNYQVRTLNRLQTVKRIRNFNIDEIGELYSIVENNDTPEDCRIGAYLLLDQQQAAELHFAKMTEEEQNNFKKYPIYHFWKTE